MRPPLPQPAPEDPANPYSAPESEIGPAGLAKGGGATIPFEIGEVLSRSWRIYRARLPQCIGIVLAGSAINVAGRLLLDRIEGLLASVVDPQSLPSAVVFVAVLLLFMQIWLGIGQNLYLLKLARGDEVDFGELFRGGPYLFPVIIATLAFGLVLAGVVAVGLIPGFLTFSLTGDARVATPAAMLVGLLGAILAGAYLGVRLSQYYYLVIDGGAGIMESLPTSLQITRDEVANLVVLLFSMAVINLGGLMACVVGLVVTYPFTSLMFCVIYLALTGQPVLRPAARGASAGPIDPLAGSS